MTEQTIEKGEARSYFVEAHEGLLPSGTAPCVAPAGHSWVHSYSPDEALGNRLLVGKWLIFVQCRIVDYCWSLVRCATEEGTLGIAAKVTTDWGNQHDTGLPSKPNHHVICVYTRDFLNRRDVLRVLKRLQQIDAIRKGTKQYKPDLATRLAMRGMTVYSSVPPYTGLRFDADVLDTLDASVVYDDAEPDLAGISPDRANFNEVQKKLSNALLRIRS